MHQFLSPFSLAIAIVLACMSAAQAADRPNIMWISCEDISPHLGCFGDPHAITPNLDALASEGVRYDHVFTAAGVCAPCRSGIITGCYQNSIGTHHMRSEAVLPKWLKPFPMLLREAAYFCTNNSKTDYQFSDPSPFEIWDESSSRAHWRNGGQQIGSPQRPFFAVFNFTGCHESGIASESKYRQVTKDLKPSQRQSAEQLTTLPPYYPDTPVTREDWKRNYELITAMDAWAGQLVEELKAAGLYEDTIIFFWSDHGVGLPRAKRWLYESGTHVPCIIRIPAKFRQSDELDPPGSINHELVSSIDFGATVLNLAGVQVPDYMQGRAFLGENLSPVRKYVYGSRDRMDERYDIQRSVRDQRYRYIRNFEPLVTYYQYMNTAEQGATMQEIRRAERMGALPEPAQPFSAPTKPMEELYDLHSDPHEIHNLAADPQYRQRLESMRAECLRWQLEIRDIGLVPEAEMEIREQLAGSRFDILRGPDGEDMVRRLVDTAAKASEGPSAAAAMLAALRDTDAAVRYWGATGLGNSASAIKLPVAEPIIAALNDSSPNVRIAAARALCRMGDLERGLPVLQQELAGQHPWGRLAAAIVLDELDEDARPALADLQAALENQPNKYIVRVANKAVNDLLGTHNQVP